MRRRDTIVLILVIYQNLRMGHRIYPVISQASYLGGVQEPLIGTVVESLPS